MSQVQTQNLHRFETQTENHQRKVREMRNSDQIEDSRRNHSILQTLG
jgi:hypothetical protein